MGRSLTPASSAHWRAVFAYSGIASTASRARRAATISSSDGGSMYWILVPAPTFVATNLGPMPLRPGRRRPQPVGAAAESVVVDVRPDQDVRLWVLAVLRPQDG